MDDDLSAGGIWRVNKPGCREKISRMKGEIKDVGGDPGQEGVHLPLSVSVEMCKGAG